ncbi:hypothetical protein [Leptolyngbya sp. PCC 6406]|uniref:CIS tube protein n=1 Tax=Leptolyngbya sp. PCC 6406 TaxID=1173264 RepID=UPI0002ABC4B2|nr:hypothetical protein [Leptolyngbya sp. PCC 6406]
MPLEKAKLIAVDGGENIEFMFNPTELTFNRSVSIDQAPGAQTQAGENKTSFKHPNPYSLSISNIILDTYEDGSSVLIPLGKFTKAVEFASSGEGAGKRPPIYLFTWGSNDYLRCFVKTLNFKLTLFMPDGTPVRASIDLSLEQADAPTPEPSQGTPQPSAGSRQSSSRQAFLS